MKKPFLPLVLAASMLALISCNQQPGNSAQVKALEDRIRQLEDQENQLQLKAVRSQPIYGNGGHDNYGRGEKVSERKVNEIGALYVASSCAGLGYCA